MKSKKTESRKKPPRHKTAKELAGAMFAVADKKLPAEKRRFTKSVRMERKDIEPEQGGN